MHLRLCLFVINNKQLSLQVKHTLIFDLNYDHEVHLSYTTGRLNQCRPFEMMSITSLFPKNNFKFVAILKSQFYLQNFVNM